MSDFYAIPESTTYTPFSSPVTTSVVVQDIFTPVSSPILPISPFLPAPNLVLNNGRTILSNIPRVGVVGNVGNVGVVGNLGVSSVYNPNNLFYYDSIGNNPLAVHKINTDLRYKFLDKWLHKDHSDILKMLRVDNGSVKVLSKSETEKNDIGKDSEKDLEKKSDYIGTEILTLGKNKKILWALCQKNNIRYYDLPHNEHYVSKSQARYVRRKLGEMQK